MLPIDVKSEIVKYIKVLKPKIGGVKWEAEDKIHITLKFIGEAEPYLVDEISRCIIQVSKDFGNINLNTTVVSAFPNISYPRLIVLFLKHSELLLDLNNKIQDSLENLSIEKDKRFFIPHITLGRVKGKTKIPKKLPDPPDVSFTVNEIGLIKSELTKKGSIYSTLKLIELLS